MSKYNKKSPSNQKASSDYDVGYKKPPKSGQFKPGHSGNPKGRRKGARGLKTDLREEMSQLVTILEGGKSLKITKQRLLIKRLAERAANGDVRAAEQLISLIIQAFGLDDHRTGRSQLSRHDAALVAEMDEHLAGDGQQAVDGEAGGGDNIGNQSHPPTDDEEPDNGA